MKANKLIYLILMPTLMVLLTGHNGYSQFSGAYDPANWSTVQISGGNGSVNATNAPTSIALTGPDNTAGQAYTRYQILLPAAGTLSFSWSVVHQDPTYDGFGYWLNNTYTELTNQTATGTTNITVSAGQTFAFYGETYDGCCGTFVATISNFSAPLAAVNDAGVAEITQPQGDICADTIDVYARIQNFGINQISPVTVNWSINGTVQTSAIFSGVLDTAGGSGTDTTTVFLGSVFLEDSISLLVWTSSPNNVADTNNDNDTLLLELYAANPEIEIGDQDMCEGEFFILAAPGGFVQYQWSTGASGSQIQIIGGGTYTVSATDEFGCIATDEVIVTEYPSPIVDLGQEVSGCDEYELNAGNSNSTFIWNTGATSQAITVSSSGVYGVTVENPQGCTTTEEVIVTIFESPIIELGSNFSLCIDLNETAVLAVSSQFAFYEWSTGATNSTILIGGFGTPLGNTPISVNVVDQNGCTAADTVMVLFKNCIPQGVGAVSEEASFNVYPNPSNGVFTISAQTGVTAALAIQLLDITGRTLVNQKTNEQNAVLDVQHLPKGTYYLVVSSANGDRWQEPIVIH